MDNVTGTGQMDEFATKLRNEVYPTIGVPFSIHGRLDNTHSEATQTTYDFIASIDQETLKRMPEGTQPYIFRNDHLVHDFGDGGSFVARRAIQDQLRSLERHLRKKGFSTTLEGRDLTVDSLTTTEGTTSDSQFSRAHSEPPRLSADAGYRAAKYFKPRL